MLDRGEMIDKVTLLKFLIAQQNFFNRSITLDSFVYFQHEIENSYNKLIK